MGVDANGVRLVGDLTKSYEEWQGEPARQQSEGGTRLLAIVEAVRKLCVRGDSVDQDAVAALRESTGLNFRAEGSAVLFELADDNNPGKTQTVAVRAEDADLE
jgi:hypothetical protein